MNDRLEELLKKGRAGELTPQESAEVARLINAPVLEPLGRSYPASQSRRNFQPAELAPRLWSIDWFSQCGQPLTCPLSMNVSQVDNWQAATESCRGEVWRYVELEAKNQLTLWLHLNCKSRYQSWNERVREHKSALIEPLQTERWAPFLAQHGLDSSIVNSIGWDIGGALMENSYLDCGHHCFFFLELLSFYEDGHFPCGWHGIWPNGKLLVY